MSKKNFMSYGDAETILTEYAQGVKDVKNPQFAEAATRNNIASGESYTTIFGKIKKFFSDLKTVAFTGSYNDLTDKPNLNLPLVPESGGTGQTTLENAGNAIINALSTGSSTPVDADYFISQYANGGSNIKTYHRRPISTLYAYIKSKLTASDVGALPLAGGTMTGTTSYTANKIAENYRPEHSSYYTTTAYMTEGNEALVWSTKNAVTSFMFVNGEDMIANVSSGRWRQLTPGLQIKNNKVAINKLIDTNVTPSHNLDVNGDICCTYHDGTTLKTGNRSYGEHNCNNMLTNGFYYYTSNGPSTSLGASTNDGGVFVQAYSDIWVGQIAIDYRNGRCFFRGKNNGTWSAWQAFKSQADVDSAYALGIQQGAKKVGFLITNTNSSKKDVVQINVAGFSRISIKFVTSDRNTDGFTSAEWIADGGSYTTAWNNTRISSTSTTTITKSIPSSAIRLEIESYISTLNNSGRMWISDITLS